MLAWLAILDSAPSLSLLPWLTFLSWSKDQFIDCLHSTGMILTSLQSVVVYKARFLGFDDKSWSGLRFSHFKGALFNVHQQLSSRSAQRGHPKKIVLVTDCDSLFKFTILGFTLVERGEKRMSKSMTFVSLFELFVSRRPTWNHVLYMKREIESPKKEFWDYL